MKEGVRNKDKLGAQEIVRMTSEDVNEENEGRMQVEDWLREFT